MAIYLHTPRSKASNVASFALPNEGFISGHVLEKSVSGLWLLSLLTDS